MIRRVAARRNQIFHIVEAAGLKRHRGAVLRSVQDGREIDGYQCLGAAAINAQDSLSKIGVTKRFCSAIDLRVHLAYGFGVAADD